MATLLKMGLDEPFVAAAFGNLAPTFDPESWRPSYVTRNAGPARRRVNTNSSL
jgi:hypothetical protein